ncbi:competence protein CoiA [Ktedonospora formicarum]|uniref:Competence protein CoiA n=1 Tax=Ktedonospora formicarum TaxID=2778364 RepID=A0A8J3I2I5_9CHLR|nr:competence protein CoiA family protein [Ktedonospora formicarum]GHO45600.1 hypothetical protein KSX_37630 [Ktedonospora formicarum]
MLVAYGPEDQTVIASETSLEQLQIWSRSHKLHCPNCRGEVHLRGGGTRRLQPHFAHQRGECAWSTEGESVQHMRGKAMLARWLQTLFPTATVTLEVRLPEPNRIADVFMRHANGMEHAVEYQCAPLEINEWRHRHDAYRAADIVDTWIIGSNRREKQEAFIEAILQTSHEILFIDPQVTPPRTWLRWRLTREEAREWQNRSFPRERAITSLEGWVGRGQFGATLIGPLHDIRLDEQGRLHHPIRESIEIRGRTLRQMEQSHMPDPNLLSAYLRPHMDEQVMRTIVMPLLNSYLLDPDLLHRYNYGRGLPDHPLSASDHQRVEKARTWLAKLAHKGYSPERLQEISLALPFVGPYAAFARYMETLIELASAHEHRLHHHPQD